MYKIRIVFVIFLIFLILSCINNSSDANLNSNTTAPDYSDPDPLSNEELLTAPSAPANLFLVVNVDGEIRSFQSDDPSDHTILVSDASIEPYFEGVKLSDDKNYLLYVNSDKDLILLNVFDKTIKDVLMEGVSSNETQFIDSDRIQYSHGGNIYCYTISTAITYEMIDNPVYHCNHGAVVSPDGTKIVFKNQDPSQSDYAVYVWANVTDSTETTCTLLGDYTGDINLLELLEFIWVSDELLFLKPNPYLNNRIKAYGDLNQPFPVSANVIADGSAITFSELSISEDRTKLCAYGAFGLYQVDISTIDFSSSIAVDEIYKSDVVTTKFAAYSYSSDYLVAATSGCINIYVSDSLQQTDFVSSQIISEGETIFSIDCK